MNQEVITFLEGILSQVIAGVPYYGTLGLTLLYAFKSFKNKVAEYPNLLNDFKKLFFTDFDKFKGDVVGNFQSMKQEVIAHVDVKLEVYEKQAQGFMDTINAYKTELEDANKVNKALVAQNEIVLDVLKVFISKNDEAVISGISASALAKIKEYQEHAYVANEIVKKMPEVKEKVIFLAEKIPNILLDKLAELPIEVLEEAINEYEKTKPQK